MGLVCFDLGWIASIGPAHYIYKVRRSCPIRTHKKSTNSIFQKFKPSWTLFTSVKLVGLGHISQSYICSSSMLISLLTSSTGGWGFSRTFCRFGSLPWWHVAVGGAPFLGGLAGAHGAVHGCRRVA
jgi:hypothetical protein